MYIVKYTLYYMTIRGFFQSLALTVVLEKAQHYPEILVQEYRVNSALNIKGLYMVVSGILKILNL